MRHIVLLMALLVSGCTATGPAFDRSMVKDNLVVYRPYAYSGVAMPFTVKINGKEVCKIHNQSFFTYDMKGDSVIESSVWGTPGYSTIEVEKKKLTYMRMIINQGKQNSQIVAGYAGLFVHEGLSENPGPFLFTEVPEQQALKELEGLKRDCE